ncbi:helicase-associated domain-containing protein [Paenibacillus protaetiae]|uniref:Helicase XPB/Ssl2 N-terminal domain-containing protein n=1 Tax=Paenibacillus protaetiae TaxID=2509456 RepID=A0A4P6ER60_9BACL|nr:helicase-associated domain-containing protein [Paenibacillus protaetiae]QAY65500.1 hypothetical protein ET464_03005 [Paenibacillus protaetiae]
MYVQQIVQKLPQNELQQLLEETPVWQHARQEGLAWPDAVRDEQALRKAISALTPYGAYVLKFQLRYSGGAPLEEEQLLKAGMAAGVMAGIELRAGIRELLACGLLFAVNKIWGERILFVPQDCSSKLIRLFFPLVPEEAEEAGLGSGLQAFGQAALPLGRQLLGAWSELSQAGTELTAKGLLPKKITAKLQQKLKLADEILSRFFQPKGAEEEYPLSAAFVCHTGLRFGLFAKESRRLRWDKAGLTDWLSAAGANKEHELRDWLADELLAASPELYLFAAALNGLPADRWMSERLLLEWLERTVMTDAHPSRALDGLAESVRYWLELMQQCGWLERATASDGSICCRWTLEHQTIASAAEQPGTGVAPQALVQPNGEIIAFPECSYLLRWELAAAAELVEDDYVAVYRLTDRSIQRAVMNGRTAEELQQMLRAASGDAPVHEPLLDWVARTAKQAGLVTMNQAMLLQCEDKQTADDLASNPSIAACLGERLGNVIL